LAGIGASKDGSTSSSHGTTASETRNRTGLPQVCKEIAGSSFVVFLDDFHYIQESLRADIARDIKTAAERDVKICIASVPHRSDDAVRSNHELRGRTVNLDTKFWTLPELSQIGRLGFPKLNVIVDDASITEMARQSCGSPQLMQSLCLDVCRNVGARETLIGIRKLVVENNILQNVLEDTASRANYSSLVRDLHQGPRRKGQPRDTFNLSDGTVGDAYRCVLLALRADPPKFQISYAELLDRVNLTCLNSRPSGSSIQNACRQMTKIAVDNSPEQRIIEWDERAGSGTLSIVDPYFLFFIRHSRKLEELGNP
jgi:hypothetical protein